MSVPICRHRKADGTRCGSPALRGEKVCYFHTRQRRDAILGARAHRRRYECQFTLPALDDPRTIQHLLSQIFGALMKDTIDPRRASAMLTALRMAMNELYNPRAW